MKISTHAILIFSCCACYSLKAQNIFKYTGAVQTYTVPECAGSITVDMKGGEGSTASSSTQPGGKGGQLQATLAVTPGEVLTIYVGGSGTVTAGGWNGGANPGAGSGAGGGGASDIRRGNALYNRIAVASGGGGAGAVYAVAGSKGGDGGGLKGKAGQYSGSYNASWCGSGGTQTEGGQAATSNGAVAGEEGSGGIGGTMGGGGGGGYYGGGGGSYGGGGGGSSYADSLTATNLIHTSGVQAGNGQIVITPLPGPSAPGIIAGADSVCAGSTVSYSIDAVPDVLSYNWTFPEGTTLNYGQGSDSVVVTLGNTSGNMSVTAANSCGTSPARTKALTVMTCTGINNISTSINLSVFPNPANKILHIRVTHNGLLLNTRMEKQLLIELINTQGQVVYSVQADGVSGNYLKEADISALPKGIYYVQFKHDDFFSVRKIVFN